MAVAFVSIALLTTYSAYFNARGSVNDRYTTNVLGPIEFAATHLSIANLGNSSYSTGGTYSACNANGFASTVCSPNGWMLGATASTSAVNTAWNYPCGTAPSSLDGSNYVVAGFIFGGLSAKCTASVVECQCFPGYMGANCEKCAPGYGAPNGSLANAGTGYNGAPAASICAPCPPGSYGSSIGASTSVCTSCPTGTFSNATGATSLATCMQCPPQVNASAVSCSAQGAVSAAACTLPCNISAASAPPAAIRGWCVPPLYSGSLVDGAGPNSGQSVNYNQTWWTIGDLTSRNAAEVAVRYMRGSGFCSNAGACTARVPELSLGSQSATPSYAFCACDPGFWGERCQHSDGGLVHGSYYSYAYSVTNANLCPAGALPSISTSFFTQDFPISNCSLHGIGMSLPVNPDGTLGTSNFFRTQTNSTCFCEPGFDGEECLGGVPVPVGEGWVNGATTVVLLVVVTILYRDRRRMMKAYNVEIISSKDYTVFVNFLPMVHLDHLTDVTKHFEQWGPVHATAPALSDRDATLLQKQKNEVLFQLRVLREKEAYARKHEIWERSVKLAEKENKLAVLNALRAKKGEGSEPGVQCLEDSPEEKAFAEPSAASGVALAPLTLLEWATVYTGIGASRSFLYKYRMYLDHHIKAAVENPDARRFARCFVTFKTVEARNNCLASYSERRQGLFGKLPDYDPRILYQGKHWISVDRAVDPEEVDWNALATGPRVRSFLMLIGFVLLIGIMLGMFELVIVTNHSQATGIIGLLSSLALTVMQISVAIIWDAVSYFERHHYVGNRVRSMYLKTTLTQIFIIVLGGTLGVYGFPIDFKNGYIQDWYASAGGFLFRQVIIETLVPPVMDFGDLPTIINAVLSRSSKSKAEKDRLSRPSPPNLAMRCASLMRTIIMCCAFNAGLPILNVAVAVALVSRYFSDKYCYTNTFAVLRYGPELARSLEITLMFSTAVNCVMGWITLEAGWQSNIITEAMFYIGIIGLLWAILGYFSYRWYRGLDCWAGSGPICPCSGWLCCFNRTVLAPFTSAHVLFMTVVFGIEFIDEKSEEDNERAIVTGGLPYETMISARHLKRQPYTFFERGQIFPELDSGDKEPLLERASEYRARMAKK